MSQATTEDLEEQHEELRARLDRIERLVRGQSPTVPDDASFSYKEASIYFVTGRNPHWMTEDERARAEELLDKHSMSPRKMAELCKDETAALPYRVKAGRSAIVPAIAIKRYKQALRKDAVKAQHRVEP